MAKDRPAEVGTTELRLNLADVLNAAVYGEITFVTTRKRRIAAIVPAVDAERLWAERQAAAHDEPSSSA
jgi:prevent-host-death family protein